MDTEMIKKQEKIREKKDDTYWRHYDVNIIDNQSLLSDKYFIASPIYCP